MMSTIDIIITIVVVSLCSSLIAATVVYYILDKKYRRESEWLFDRIWDVRGYVNRFYDKYINHMIDYHKGNSNDAV